MYQPSSYQMAQSRIADMHSQAARRALARTARQARVRPGDGNPLTRRVRRVLALRLRATGGVRTA
jgi:hypothetical protein